jgi:hypothetical protein
MDAHSPKDQDVIVWVTRSLAAEKWTAIREIGVEYDAALVVTTLRATPQSSPTADTFAVWSVSLTNHSLTPVLKGVNLRWLDWMRFAEGAPQELAVLYDSCSECAADTYFTAFRYDMAQHMWTGRWMRGGEWPGPRCMRRWPSRMGGNCWALGTTLTTASRRTPRTLFIATTWTPSAAWSAPSCLAARMPSP